MYDINFVAIFLLINKIKEYIRKSYSILLQKTIFIIENEHAFLMGCLQLQICDRIWKSLCKYTHFISKLLGY